MGSNLNERRKTKRCRYSCPVGRVQEAGDLRMARLRDISTTGASVQCADPPPAGCLLLLEFRIRSIPVEIDAEVVWSILDKGVGVRFSDLTPGKVALIADSLPDIALADVHLGAVQGHP